MFDRPPRTRLAYPDITHRDIRATVKWYNPTKGFGFVAPVTGGKDVFVHIRALDRLRVREAGA